MAKDKAKLLLIVAIPVTSHLNDVVDSSNKMPQLTSSGTVRHVVDLIITR